VGAIEDGKRALERLKVRREMRSMDLEEDSQVIEQEAQSRAAPAPSLPPPFSWVLGAVMAVVQLVPKRQRLWPVLMLLGLGAGYAAHKAGIW
jgi:hypothetical protein